MLLRNDRKVIVKHTTQVVEKADLGEIAELNTIRVGDVLPHFMCLDVSPLPTGLRKSAGLSEINTRAFKVGDNFDKVPHVGEEGSDGQCANAVEHVAFMDNVFV